MNSIEYNVLNYESIVYTIPATAVNGFQPVRLNSLSFEFQNCFTIYFNS